MIYQQELICVNEISVSNNFDQETIIDYALQIACTANPAVPKVRPLATGFIAIDNEITVLACQLLANSLNFEGLYFILCNLIEEGTYDTFN